LKDAQLLADGAAPHLLDHAESLASSLREEMRKEYSSRLQKNMEKMKWPGRDLVLADSIATEWMEIVQLLLELQKP
jgi:RAD50-interacting protein 1